MIVDRPEEYLLSLIQEAVETGSIKPFDKTASKKMMMYVPHWA